jgi:signal transduction histidine kinase
VHVNLSVSSASVHYVITDNGIGFDPSQVKPTSLGMRIMRERAEAIGADLHVQSARGRGATVEATWSKTPGSDEDGKESE